MSNYPAKLAVIAPTFMTAQDEKANNAERQHTYLLGFSLFSVERAGDAFSFKEHSILAKEPTDSLDLLIALGKDLDPEASLAGQRLDHIVSLLIRTPVGEVREADGIAPLNALRQALRNEVFDVDWYGNRGSSVALERLAFIYGLSAIELDPCERNPTIIARKLFSRAQSIWLAIAEELLPRDEWHLAIGDYGGWRAAHPID